MIKKAFLSTVIILATTCVFAYSETPQNAQIACLNATNVAINKSPEDKALDPNLCKMTSYSASQWHCVKTGVENGNSFIFSTSQCFKNPGTGPILVGKGQEIAANKLCLSVTQYATENEAIRSKNGKVNYSFLCKFNTRNTAIWTCMQNVIEKQHKNFIYAQGQCVKN